MQKLLQVLRSQLSFLQYLFQREPDALKGQEDEWMQLEVRAKARQQQALEQEVASEKRLQVCNVCLLRAKWARALRNVHFFICIFPVQGFHWNNQMIIVLVCGGLCFRTGSAGRMFVVGWVECWKSLKPLLAVKNQREMMMRKRRFSADWKPARYFL